MVKPSFVVGLGASAGGLEALERFFDNTPADSGGAFIVVMHLSRDFKSMLDELLARHTKMKVCPVVNGETLEANTIYVIQASQTIELRGLELVVSARPTVDHTGPAITIDLLFKSIAKEWGDRGGAVLLSGSGSDGAHGITAVRNAGGFTCVQSPETARFDSMPVAAISSGAVRAVEAPEHLAQTVIEGIQLARLYPDSRLVADHDTALARILKAVVGVGGIDATQYKHSTFERRVRRRMAEQNISSLITYADMVSDDPIEAARLGETLLIGVTEFFRDDDPFKIIQSQVVPELIRNAQLTNQAIRVWVPGCATGEEAYTLAILFATALEDMPHKVEVQIFATDIKREYLSAAGRGEYSTEKIRNVPPIFREKYFSPVAGSDQLAIDPDIRKMIVFAPHDVLSDPPFTRLHLISCRNLLIYFSIEAQQKILAGFSFGLLEKGFLLLGSSETVGGHREAFEYVDARNRLFRRTGTKKLQTRFHGNVELPSRDGNKLSGPIPKQTLKLREAALQPAYSALLRDFAPPSLLLSSERELLHSFGDARRFLRPPEGVAHLDASEMVDGAIKTPIIAGMERVLRDRQPITFSKIEIKQFPEPGLKVDVTLRPLQLDNHSSPEYFLVLIDPSKYEDQTPENMPIAVLDPASLTSERVRELEDELDRTREALQSTIEEIETTNEELQASNEELMSSNEELQSTNEELSSVNEELYSVNAEYHRQNDELMRLSTDFDLLLKSTEIGVIFLDSELCITRFTSLAAELFNLQEADIGRTLANFRSPFENQDIVKLLEGALKAGTMIEHEDSIAGMGQWLIRAVSNPARQGVVLTLINIVQLRKAEEEAAENYRMLQKTRRLARAFLVEFDIETKTIIRAIGHEEFTGRKRVPPMPIDAEAIHPEDRHILADLLANPPISRNMSTVLRLWSAEHKNYRYVRYSGEQAEQRNIWLITGLDIDDLVRSQERTQHREEIIDGILKTLPSLVGYVDRNLKYRYVNEGYAQFFGVPRDKIIGHTLGDFVPERAMQIAETHIEGALAGRTQSFMAEFAQANGDEIKMSVIFEPVFTASGEVDGFALNAINVTQQYGTTAHKAEEERLMEKAARASQIPTFFVEADTGHVLAANLDGRTLLGVKPYLPLPQGLRISRLTPEIGDKRWQSWMSDLRIDEQRTLNDVLVFQQNQNPEPTDLLIFSFMDQDRKIVVIKVLEIKERHLALQDLKDRSRELAISNRDLEQFASIVAHDLRAPLRHVNQFSGLIRSAIETSDQTAAGEYISIIEDSTRNMSDMVEGLLDYARTGRTIRPFKEVDLNTVVKAATLLLKTEIDSTNTVLEVADLPTIKGDADLLKRLFQNLIANAIKYHKPHVSPVIRISGGKTNGHFEIAIEDNGIGIAPEFSDRIFKLFQRLHSDEAYSGLGVGLATCLRICEIHGGMISLDTEYTEGARFRIELPASPAERSTT